MQRGQGQWPRLLRRGAALFLATVTVWLLSLTADTGSAAVALRTLAESPAFVSAALRAELGNLPEDPADSKGLTGWQQLILSQSPALMAGAGSTDPFAILPAVWITSLASVSAGLLAARLLGGRA